MKKYKEEGFFTGACFIPVLPFLSDSEKQIEETIRTVKEYQKELEEKSKRLCEKYGIKNRIV